MKTLLAFISLLAFILQTTPFIAAQNNDKLPPVAYQEYKLPNGLRVIMHQDKSTPIVTVNTWYHVGSKNDAPGKTGFAHLFEHMMFQGSKNYNADYFKALGEAGSTNLNGTTTVDRTNYYQTVPSNFLELALFMEADRMGGLLEAMTLEKLNNQRDVVKNERRQRYDNQPYGTALEKISQLMYPKEHPYHWTTIGSLDDLTAASLDDVKAFFREYYVPNNATLVIAGDFQPNQAKAWVEKYFGPISKGADIKRPTPKTPTLNGEIRKTFEDIVPLSRLYMIWHSVAQYSPDAAALEMLGNVLAAGRSSRLQNNLVQTKQIAQSVGAYNNALEIAGRFQITVTARSGKSLDEIEKEINTEIEGIKQEPPTTDEVIRALNGIESSFIFGLEMIHDKADKMNAYATMIGKPDYFQADLERYRKVTPADIQRVAKTYLTGNRVVLSVVPNNSKTGSGGGISDFGGGGLNQLNMTLGSGTGLAITNNTANQNNPFTKEKKENNSYAANLPKPGPDPKLSLPPIEKAKLSNGLEVRVVRHSELPVVSMNLTFKSGVIYDPSGKSGVASLTAALLDDGTTTRSAIEIANQLQAIGAFFNTGSSWDGSGVAMQTLMKNFDRALDIYADVVVNPVFPEEEFMKYRQGLLGNFAARRLQPGSIADTVFNKILYGKNHPYGRQLSGDEISVKSITRNDIQSFYQNYYRPNNATLIVVGDVDTKILLPKLEKVFANWKPAYVKTVEVPNAVQVEKTGIYLFDKPGAAQSVVSIGQVGVARSNPDYFPLLVMNSILGGGFSSRINMNLREDKGYTYGAGSNYSFRSGAGPFTASSNVHTAVTKESVAEFMKELRGIRGEIPVTSQELVYNKQSLIRRHPSAFERSSQIGGQLVNLVIHDLPDTYFNDYIGKINAVTIQDVNRVASKYLDPSKMAIIVVGDRSTVEPKLKELGFPVTIVDAEGNPVLE